MFKVIMITVIVILAIAWIVYGIWRYRTNLAEKDKPKPTTEKSFTKYYSLFTGYNCRLYFYYPEYLLTGII